MPRINRVLVSENYIIRILAELDARAGDTFTIPDLLNYKRIPLENDDDRQYYYHSFRYFLNLLAERGLITRVKTAPSRRATVHYKVNAELKKYVNGTKL